MSRRLKIAFVIVSGLLSVAYLGKGFAVGLLDRVGADRERRWTEQQYVIRGQNPYDVAFRAEAEAAGHGTAGSSSGRNDASAADLGVPRDVDYPPWSYFSGYLFFSVPPRLLRPWYTLIQAASLASVVAIVWRLGRGLPALDRAVPVLAMTSIASICTDLGTGNYGLPLLALLLWAFAAEEAGRTATGGLLLGLVQLKPNLTGPFLLVPLVRGNWRSLAVAAAYLVVASGVVWAATATDPVEMCGQMVRAAKRHVAVASGPLNLAISLGVPYERAVGLVALACVAIGLALMIERRHDDRMVLYAIAAVTARFWTYHLNYSNLILAFLSLALWRTAVATGRRSAWGLFLLVTASLWIPAKLADLPAGQAAERVAWLVGLAGLILLRRSLPAAPATESGATSRPVVDVAAAPAP